MMDGIRVCVGNWDDHLIPPELWDVRMNNRGWPDKRYKADRARFMTWYAKQEAAAEAKRFERCET